jgi:hexosaminidase
LQGVYYKNLWGKKSTEMINRSYSVCFLITFFLIFFSFLKQVAAQNKSGFSVNDLSIKWELVSNQYQGKTNALNSITIINNGRQPLPSTGWSIVFSSSREIFDLPAADGIKFEHINGDLYKLYPIKGFSGIKSRQAARTRYISNGVSLNFSAAPSGMYLVWDNQPDRGVSLKNPELIFSDSSIRYKTPADVYAENKFIETIPYEQLPVVFPSPVSCERGKGDFVLDKDVAIIAGTALSVEANYLAAELTKLTGKQPVVATAFIQAVKSSINLQLEPMKEEGYKLIIRPDNIQLSASSGAGIFYGIQTLKSMMAPGSWSAVNNTISIPCAVIMDEPRFSVRSLMMDIARNFQPKKELLRVIDLMSLYKLNMLHLHFNDDEGWRIEMPSFPELTVLGSLRGHPLDSKKLLPASYGAGPVPGKPTGSGHYTRAEFIEILKYARERHISIVPEIETPGHARAAIKSMDARYEKFIQKGNKEEAERYLLRDLNDLSEYSTAQAWTDNVMCVALSSVYNFIEQLVDDISGIYKEAGVPLSTIHFGGDEVPDGAWERSPKCQELIKNDSLLKETNDLWYYYFTRVDSILKKRNLFLSGWEEVGMRKTKLNGGKKLIVNPELANEGYRLNVWNNQFGGGMEDLPYRLANAGYKVILSPVSNNYFDMAYYRAPGEPGFYWGGFQDLDKPFYFIPFDYFKNAKENSIGEPIKPSYFIGKDLLTDYGKSNIAGIQGLIWSETIRSEAGLEYMILPKLLGLAERAWAVDPEWAKEKDSVAAARLYSKAWSVFVNVVGQRELPRLSYYGGGFQYRIPPPGVVLESGSVMVNMQLPGFMLRYTIDGEEPTLNSSNYTVPVTEKGTIKIKAFNASGRSSRTITIINH